MGLGRARLLRQPPPPLPPYAEVRALPRPGRPGAAAAEGGLAWPGEPGPGTRPSGEGQAPLPVAPVEANRVCRVPGAGG